MSNLRDKVQKFNIEKENLDREIVSLRPIIHYGVKFIKSVAKDVNIYNIYANMKDFINFFDTEPTEEELKNMLREAFFNRGNFNPFLSESPLNFIFFDKTLFIYHSLKELSELLSDFSVDIHRFSTIENGVSFSHPLNIGKNVTIRKGSTIGKNVTIEDSVYIGMNCSIEDNVLLKEGVSIDSNVKIPQNQIISKIKF